MADSVDDILKTSANGFVTTVFCDDVAQARYQLRAATEDLVPLPTLVALQWQEAPSLQMELEAIRNALADAAAELWPEWYITAEGRFDQPRERDSISPDSVERRSRAIPGTSRSWIREASRLCVMGKRPIVEQLPAAEQVRQLALALDPSRLLFALSVTSDVATPARIKGLAKAAQWLAREAQAKTLLLLPESWRPRIELDHVNYGAHTLECAVAGPSQTPPPLTTPKTREINAPRVSVGPLVGRPHPGSEVERLVFDRLSNDPELAPLFEFNQRLPASGDRHYIVDLVWRAGRVIIELDGPEHHSPKAYVDDRDRDYRLLLQGFSTLRITNAEVYVDLDRVIGKIKNVVALQTQRGTYQ